MFKASEKTTTINPLHAFLLSMDFFKINVFKIPSECQKVGIQIRPNLYWPDLDPNYLQKLSAEDTTCSR